MPTHSCYVATMTLPTLSAEQEKLVMMEAQMRAMDPATDRYWKLKTERNALRTATDLQWRHERGFGTKAERWAPLPWPASTKGRWRVLREFIEVYDDIPLGDVVPASYRSPRLSRVKKLHKKLGASLRQWVALVDELEACKKNAFRDAPMLHPVRNHFLSAMTQGEGDYEWVIHKSKVSEEDPPVIGFVLDVADTQAFIPQTKPPEFGPYGSYARLTDFIRAHLNGYLRAVGYPFDAGLRGGACVLETSPVGAPYAWAFTAVWATPLVPRVPAVDLLPADWDKLGAASEELRTRVIDAFLVADYALDDVEEDQPLAEAWKLDADELAETIADVLDVEFEIELGTKNLNTRAEIIAFVQHALAERGDDSQ